MEHLNRDDLLREVGEEGTILDFLSNSMYRAGFYSQEDAEILAYRMAEIIVTSKNLYSNIMPRLLELNSDSKDEILEFITEVRMNFQFIRDCIEEFDESFFNLMNDEKEGSADHEENEDAEQF